MTKKKTKPLVTSIVAGIVIVMTLLAVVYLYPELKVGDPLRIKNDIGQRRADFQTVMDAYKNTIDIIIASFGVIAFLVTYQQSKERRISNIAWALLSAGIIVLIGALILCFFGRELMLKMIEDNLMKFDYSPLKYSRWASYGCLVISATLIGFFAVEVAITPPLEEERKDMD